MKGKVGIGCLELSVVVCFSSLVCIRVFDGILFFIEEKWFWGRFYCRGLGFRIRFLYLGIAFGIVSGFIGFLLLVGGWFCMFVFRRGGCRSELDWYGLGRMFR